MSCDFTVLRRSTRAIAIGATMLAALCGHPGSASADCLAEANKVAAATGATIERLTDIGMVIMRHPAAEEITYGCPDARR